MVNSLMAWPNFPLIPNISIFLVKKITFLAFITSFSNTLT